MGWASAINFSYASTPYLNGRVVATYHNDSGGPQVINSFCMPMATGSGSCYAGDRVSGNGQPIYITVDIRGARVGSTITHVVSASNGYLSTSKMVNHAFWGFNLVVQPNETVNVVFFVSGGTCWGGDRKRISGEVLPYNPERTVFFHSNNNQNTFNTQGTYYHLCSIPSAGERGFYGDTSTVYFNGNGGSVSEASRNLQRTFAGFWRTSYISGNAFYQGQVYVFDNDQWLFAQWSLPKLGNLPSASRSGYIFKGWFTAPSGGTQISSNTEVWGGETFYAQWVSSPVYIRSGGAWIKYIGSGANTSNVNNVWKYTNGKWTRSGKVYKRINGAWVQQIGDRS